MHLAAKELVRIKMSTPYCNHTLRTESTAAVRGRSGVITFSGLQTRDAVA